MGKRRQSGADGGIGRDTAGDDQSCRLWCAVYCAAGAVDQAVDNGGLKAGGNVLRAVDTGVAGTQDRAFEAGKREMRFGGTEQRARERDGLGIALGCRAFDGRATGETEAEQFRGLVERLARRIVDGRCQPPVTPDTLDAEQLSMPARHQQQQIGKFEIGIGQAR